MKKVIGFLKHPLSFPLLVVVGIYTFWRFTTPMAIPTDDNFGNFFRGLIIVVIYISTMIFARAASISWKWSLLFIVLLSPVIFGTGVFSYLVFWGTEFIDWKQGKPVVLVALLVAIAYSVIALLVKSAYKKNRALSLLLFFAMVPVLGATAAYPVYFYPEKLQEGKLGKYNYYIYGVTDSDNHVFFEFFKCPQGSFNCQELTGSYSAVWEIYIDKERQEVRLLGMYNTLKYMEGVDTHWYGFEGLTTLQDATYALQYYEEDDMRRFLLNKCFAETPDSCTVIPLDFSMPASDEELDTIVENASTYELYILSQQKIQYVYGKNSPRYRYLNSLEIAGTAKYYIYSFERGNAYTYFLYGCEKDYSCWSMPFTYSATSPEQAKLQYDEKTDKLLVVVGNKLVFTYKGIISGSCYDGWCTDMQCLTEGCAFWEKQ